MDVVGHARALAAHQQHVVGLERRCVKSHRALRRQQDDAPADLVAKRRPVDMPDDLDRADIVHPGARDRLFVPGEPHRLDQIDRESETGGGPQNGADIAGDIRLVEGDTHTVASNPERAAVKMLLAKRACAVYHL